MELDSVSRMKIIIVLGSPNAPDGTLSPMAVSRLAICLKLYREGWDKILLTGGFGAHFNTSSKAHGYYLREVLINAGVKTEDILGLVESRHSVEDATLSRPIITQLAPDQVAIVTSDYHAKRAKMIFDAVYAPFDRFLLFEASSVMVQQEVLQKLTEHEHQAVLDLIENGVRF